MLDTGKLGSLREIEMTDMRSILLFMSEYPQYKISGQSTNGRRRMAYADEVDWL